MTRVVRKRVVLTSSLMRGCLGGCQLLAPALVAGAIEDQPIDAATRSVIRVLGARHLVQAALEVAAPRAGVVRFGAVIDVLHAASMVALARKGSKPASRQLARIDAIGASVFALSGMLAIGKG